MNTVAKIEQNVVSTDSVESLLTRAVDKGASIEMMERLFALRTQIKAEQAKEAFSLAMSSFQSNCPVIEKKRVVKDKNGGVRYRYANLDDIITVVSPLLSRFGLSYTIVAEFKEGFVLANCVVRHSFGHSESSQFMVPIEKDAFMNDAQKSGSALSYAKRYAFCNAFGIITGDADDDAQSLGKGVSVSDLYRKFAFTMQFVIRHYDSIVLIKDSIAKKDYAPGAETWFQLSNEVKQALWLAPTKGGPFTTEEREVMKTTEWRKAYYGDTKEAQESENLSDE